MAFSRQWETINRLDDGGHTERMAVPSGWLVRSVEAPFEDGTTWTVALTFVPDPDRAWILEDEVSG